ncbi:hypothetical protein UY3_03511 [Chelonia mydas]|uniref:Uncharacterized protein n=1 Tax=Chelonia mydas TaxID=8469 RepID=M7BTZ8_CHEMY|nr:hypothetical protein UY3_03511 [Chelonia mydas]
MGWSAYGPPPPLGWWNFILDVTSRPENGVGWYVLWHLYDMSEKCKAPPVDNGPSSLQTRTTINICITDEVIPLYAQYTTLPFCVESLPALSSLRGIVAMFYSRTTTNTAASEDPLSQSQSTLWSTPVVQFPEKSKGAEGGKWIWLVLVPQQLFPPWMKLQPLLLTKIKKYSNPKYLHVLYGRTFQSLGDETDTLSACKTTEKKIKVSTEKCKKEIELICYNAPLLVPSIQGNGDGQEERKRHDKHQQCLKKDK